EHAVERLIWSPFGLLDTAPQLMPGFEWITPYPDSIILHDRNLEAIEKRLNNEGRGFSIGDSGNICYDILQEKAMCILDSPHELECRINGIFVDSLKLGMSIGQAELNMEYAISKLNNFLSTHFNYSINKTPEFLHERFKL